MVDAIFCAFGANYGMNLQWRHIKTYITSLFDKSNTPSLNRVIILTLPYVQQHLYPSDATTAVARWIIAALAVPHSEVDQSMVEALLMVSSNDSMRTHIPVDIWVWLNKRPPLPPLCQGRFNASRRLGFCHIRGLGDIEILKSYLFLIWSTVKKKLVGFRPARSVTPQSLFKWGKFEKN